MSVAKGREKGRGCGTGDFKESQSMGSRLKTL